MTRFLIGSVLALTVLVLAIYVLGDRVARQQALSESEERARRLAQTLGRLVTDQVRDGNPEATAPLTEVLASRFEEGYLWRAKIWDSDGTILWSDQEQLVGRRYPFSPEVRRLLGTSDVRSELSTLDDPEHASERAAGEMLEVYAGSFDANGDPLLVEVYVSTAQMDEYKDAILKAFVPLGIAGLVLFQAAVLPLAVSLGRRVKKSEELRARLIGQSLQASEIERKRIAQELHDGVVQDLAGVGFSLPSVREALQGPGGDDRAAATVQQLEDIVRRDISALRSMMIDVYPPDLQATGLAAAVGDLVAAARVRGLDAVLEVRGSLDIPLDCSRLLYRVAREGLHNVVKHAHADHARVTLEGRGDVVVASVCDDGVGAGARAAARAALGVGAGGARRSDDGGSLGLQLLREAVDEAGGALTLRNVREDFARPGCCLETVVPLPAAHLRSQGFHKAPLARLAEAVRERRPSTARTRHATDTGDHTG